MTLTSEELQASWVWKHRWPVFLVCLLVLVLRGIMSSVGPPMPSLFYIPLGLVNVVAVLVIVRLAQLYYAPKRLKSEAVK